MSSADHYRKLAAQFRAKAVRESRTGLRFDFNRLAQSYVRLAEQAEKNLQTDVTYEARGVRRADDVSGNDSTTA